MGLTYRGKHSLRDFGMQTKITDLPITPPKKTDYEEVRRQEIADGNIKKDNINRILSAKCV